MPKNDHRTGETDIFVVGGGPAGLAAAIAARQAGFAVTLADQLRPPIDKTCGEGIMPEGLAALEKLGVRIPLDRAIPFQGVEFADSSVVVRARFSQGSGLGIRRTTLHQILTARALELGVQMLWGVQVTGVHPSGVSVDGEIVRCRCVVGADGQNSRVRNWSGLQSLQRTRRRRFGFRRHYRIAPWSDFVEVHWTECGQVYVTPVGSHEICVAFVTRHSGIRMEEALRHLPKIGARLKGACSISREQGALTSTFSLDKVQRGNCVLVGEASGSLDAITGEGLSVAFQQACALAEALENGDLSKYQAAHRRIERRPRWVSGCMLLLDRKHGLRRRALRAFAAEPFLFAQMLAVHTGVLSPFHFGLQGALSFGWQLVRP